MGTRSANCLAYCRAAVEGAHGVDHRPLQRLLGGVALPGLRLDGLDVPRQLLEIVPRPRPIATSHRTTHGFVTEFGVRCWKKLKCVMSESTMLATHTLR
jgi:hypothetical protein